jgi:hypothetical protein
LRVQVILTLSPPQRHRKRPTTTPGVDPIRRTGWLWGLLCSV